MELVDIADSKSVANKRMGSNPIGGTMKKRKTFKDISGNELGVGDWVLACDPSTFRARYHLVFISRLTELRLFSLLNNAYDKRLWEKQYYQCYAIKYPEKTIPKELVQDYLDILISREYHYYCFNNNIHELPYTIEY